jgi:hypothetical protein
MAHVELRGRLVADDLAQLFRIRADLRLGTPTRAVVAVVVIVLSVLLGIGLLVASHAPHTTERVILLVVLVVVLAEPTARKTFIGLFLPRRLPSGRWRI